MQPRWVNRYGAGEMTGTSCSGSPTQHCSQPASQQDNNNKQALQGTF